MLSVVDKLSFCVESFAYPFYFYSFADGNIKSGMNMVEVKEPDFLSAYERGADAFIHWLADVIVDGLGGELTAGSLSLLTAEQHTLLAYRIFRDEVLEGGFCQLVQNGYGPYIFDNPFAKALRLWGLRDLSKLIYKAKKVYDAHREDLERERTDEEFMAMYEQYEAFDEPEDEYIENEEELTTAVAAYVYAHPELFVKVEKG